MGNKTPLYDRHIDAGAKIVDFGGWDMPLHYGSQLDEHHAVRRSAGVFDVSHMTVIDVDGAGGRDFLARLLANNIDKLTASGFGLYSCMLNETAGVIDDLIAYRLAGNAYRLVVNAATRDKDLAWLEKVAAEFDVSLMERRELIMLAIQGPIACATAAPLLPESIRDVSLELRPFHCVAADGWFVARTGYTGEDGWEVILPVEAGLTLWDACLSAGVVPCGLGARDTLRLEAGLSLYGQDMDETVSPLSAALGWTVAWEPDTRDFIGRQALTAEKQRGKKAKLVGLVLADRGIMRHGQRVITDAGDGEITSGGFSPTMERSIALARVPVAASGNCQVEIRKALREARVVRPPFVRNGKILIEES